MSDLRFDPISGHWTVVADNRNDRPIEFLQVESVRKSLICPFCGGNEQETPRTETMYASDGSSMESNPDEQGNENDRWSTRVVRNKYASLGLRSVPADTRLEKDNEALIDGGSGKFPHGPYFRSVLPGPQELIIPSRRHVSSISALYDDELKVLFLAAQDRQRLLRDSSNVKHGMLFMNCRSQAGATLQHIHLQLMGAPVVSDYLKNRVQRNRVHLDSNNETIMSALLRWEIEQKTRIVYQAKYFTVVCPYASRLPFQTWIIPNESGTSFLDIDEETRDELAFMTRDVVRRLEGALDSPSYNLLLHVAPFAQAAGEHWYLEILPRTTRAAGFEWGTDVWVNPIAPEMAAKQLRS